MVRAFRLVMLLSIVISLAGCSSVDPAAQSVMEISVSATDLAFSTNLLEAAVEQPLRVTFNNEGVLEHDFTILEMPHTGEIRAESGDSAGAMAGHHMDDMAQQPDIHISAAPGAGNAVVFTPSTTGEYEYYCTVAGHKEAGMSGVLVVKDS